jgi:penicillin-binding protein 1B
MVYTRIFKKEPTMRIIKRNIHLIIPLFKGIGIVFVLILMGTTAYGWSLSKDVEKRFSGRRWSIPSKVYSDSTILYPGQLINTELFLDRLKGLGYRETANTPAQKGEMRRKGRIFEVYLRDLDLPAQKREGFPVKITVSEEAISDISNLQSGESIPILELEPEELSLFFGPDREQRKLISIDQVPDHVKKAVLAAEDAEFYKHHGLDFSAIIRALYKDVTQKGIRQGGSTITQQLAKNYFLTPERTLSRKLKEMFLAVVMETKYEKNEILEIYLNEIYFGQNGSVAINGLGEASYFYFGKSVDQLNLEEGATIAGLIRAPNLYSPYINLERSKSRRDQVLKNMAKKVWITQAEYDAASAPPVKPSGTQTYGRKAPYFIDYLSTQLEDLYSEDDLSTLGLSIYTTIDPEVQKAAELALSRGLAKIEKANPRLKRKDPQKQLQAAIIVMQPKTGYILAMVGGRDYGVSQFNRITQAKRQPGSAFKPFVYLSALDHFTPATILSNVPVTYKIAGKEWTPENYSPVPEEEMSLRMALARSVNIATVDLAMKTGLDNVVKTASAFHFSTPLKPVPSMALGSLEIIPLELARAYCAFAADGLLPIPLSLKSVSDENGQALNSKHLEVEHVVEPSKAYIMDSLLNSVVVEGTAASLSSRGISQPVAAKTGTTSDSRDAWFVGYTPDILALVWVGFDDGTSMEGTGASAALPIWADLMKNIPQYLSGGWFRRPEGVVDRVICTESGQLAIPGRCPDTLNEVFLEQLAPTEYCTIHQGQNPLKKIYQEIKDLVTKP